MDLIILILVGILYTFILARFFYYVGYKTAYDQFVDALATRKDWTVKEVLEFLESISDEELG